MALNECYDFTEVTYDPHEYRVGIVAFIFFVAAVVTDLFMFPSYIAAQGTGSASLIQFTSNYLYIMAGLCIGMVLALIGGARLEVRQFNGSKSLMNVMAGFLGIFALAVVIAPIEQLYNGTFVPPPSYIAQGLSPAPSYIFLQLILSGVNEEMVRLGIFCILGLFIGDGFAAFIVKDAVTSFQFAWQHWWGYTLDPGMFLLLFAAGSVLGLVLYLTKDVTAPMVAHVGWNALQAIIAGVI